jgi:hypothetical protein
MRIYQETEDKEKKEHKSKKIVFEDIVEEDTKES